MALEDHGPRRRARAGSASSRPATRSTRSWSTRRSDRPLNPMVNAGAIAATGLRARATAPTTAPARLLEHVRPLRRAARSTIDEAVYASERATGDRNRAIAYLMRNARRCSTSVEDGARPLLRGSARCSSTCRDLAADGRDARQRRREPGHRRASARRRARARVLSVMITCGMYDYRASGCTASGCRPRAASAGGMHRGAARAARHRRVLAAARRARQQRARRARVRGARRAVTVCTSTGRGSSRPMRWRARTAPTSCARAGPLG